MYTRKYLFKNKTQKWGNQGAKKEDRQETNSKVADLNPTLSGIGYKLTTYYHPTGSNWQNAQRHAPTTCSLEKTHFGFKDQV